jgi:hypothetical protein
MNYLTFNPFEIPYLLEYGELICAYLPDGIEKLVHHFESLLVQI